MFICNDLVKALRHQYTGTYKQFEYSIIESIKNSIKELSCSDNSNCIIKDRINNDLTYGMTIGTNIIGIKKEVITKLQNGDIKSLFVIFHELGHIEINNKIQNGDDSIEIIDCIKDKLLMEYFNYENSKYCILSNYYYDNYANYSSEVLANKYALLNMKTFLFTNNIVKSQIGMNAIDTMFSFVYSNNKKRDLSSCATFNDNYLPLDEVFEFALSYHPEWLEKYPQLKKQKVLKNRKYE